MLDEDLLIDKAKSGDRNALNDLIAAYWQPVYRFVSYKTGNPEDAQEITQETFVRTFRALPNYQKTGTSFKTYLDRIALNLVIDFWRKKGRCPAVVDLAEYEEPIAETEQPDTQAVNRETSESIALVIKELPEEQRRTVELRIIAGLPVRETAIALGKSEAAIKMLQQRALKNLRTLLLAKGIVENCAGR